ncbi:MAG TPA: hypothetical protein VF622_05685 [Segetibacter sp.]
MRTFYLLIVLIGIFGCKKENQFSRLQFTTAEKEWLIYQQGQQFKFKNSSGDSLIYSVTKVEHTYDTREYTDTSFSKVASLRETYFAKLESSNDSIIIYFYKASQFGYDPNKMQQTIRWRSVKNQFVELSAIKDRIPFDNRTINGVTYTRVTQALPLTQTTYSFTRFDYAYYDQKAGFIEIIDLNGISWKRD